MRAIKTYVSDAYLRIKYEIDCRLEQRAGGLCHFVQCLACWLQERPRRVACSGCGRPMWVHGGEPDYYMYCSQQCAYYGIPELTEIDEDVIEF